MSTSRLQQQIERARDHNFTSLIINYRYSQASEQYRTSLTSVTTIALVKDVHSIMSSHTTNSMLSNLTPTQIRLYEKQQEHASLQALKEASGQMLERVEELARMSHVMADGGAGEFISLSNSEKSIYGCREGC